MTDQQFEIDPAAVNALARDYHQEAAALPGDAISFGDSAGRIGEAFGILGICDGASQQYATLLNSTLNALGRVAELLEVDADQLAQTADAHAANETQLRQHFARVHQSF